MSALSCQRRRQETEVKHGHGHRGMRWTFLGWNREGAKFVRRAQCGGYELLMAGSSRCHDGGTQAARLWGSVGRRCHRVNLDDFLDFGGLCARTKLDVQYPDCV
jgi:hypothetical protein